MILFNAGYNREKKEPLFVTFYGMEYNVETHEDTAYFSLKEFDRFIATLIESRDHFMQHLQ